MRGYVIVAQNTKLVNYVECAEALVHSIKKYNKTANVSLISNDISMCDLFDNIIELPYGDQGVGSNWKLINDWQVYDASPYSETIKIEADILATSNLDYLFNSLNIVDVCLCTDIRDYACKVNQEKIYRKFIVDNKLPDVYNAITVFRKSEFAKKFFDNVRFVFENWEDIKTNFICNVNEPATTDFVYAIVANIMGIENVSIPNFISMVHMKQFIVNTKSEDWTKELVYEFEPLRIQKHTQTYPVHYNVKEFAREYKKYYGRI